MLPALPRALVAALLLTLPLALLPASLAHAAERTVSGGRLDWGVKSSFRTYVTGPVAQGGWSLSAGAATLGTGAFRFHSAQGSYDPGSGATTARYAGGVRFTGHPESDGSAALDLTLSNPTVRLSGGSGTLHADMRSRDRASGDFLDRAQVPLATLNLTGVDLRGGTGVAVSGIPATLTAEGAVAFAGYYEAGTALDPVSLSADTLDPDPGQEDAPETPGDPDPADGEAAEEEAGPADTGAIADAVVDWGVRRTFREYVTGEIAAGTWEVTDGARDGGAVFRFTAGKGNHDARQRTVDARFSGTLHFTGNGLDLTLSAVTVSVQDGEGTLSADVRSDGTTEKGRPLVTFDAPSLAPEEGLLLVTEAPARLTDAGAAAFGGLYAAGTGMDPVTLAVALDAEAELPVLPDLGSEPPAEPEPAGAPVQAPGHAEPGDAGPAASSSSLPLLATTAAGALLLLSTVCLLLLRRNRRPADAATPPPTTTPPGPPGTDRRTRTDTDTDTLPTTEETPRS
ncbi:HtaA domain-containing protein [Streptomyces sp. ACA25]|uniref:HtaA domain-containing protein n=1 Tax=Streptomyces sp. ACA25 TaxID=3022596 RepID=UPI00230730E7|nr:HtaA domain-containing protein [Streptomyces sp. ACA25]MDB1087828.1 HtaA domain-containing protein [Streptomyces sp. ACA25]